MGYDFSNVINLMNQGRYDDAENILIAIQNHPDQARVNYYLAQVYLKKGWLESAVECAGKAYSLEPDNREYTDFYNNLNSQRNVSAAGDNKAAKAAGCCCAAFECGDCCCEVSECLGSH